MSSEQRVVEDGGLGHERDERAEGKAEGRAEGKAEGRAEGKAEGRAEGEARGKVEALLVILAARSLVPTGDQRARIVAERDGSRLDRWLARAVQASSVGALIENGTG